MSYASKVQYTGDGVIRQFNIPFPYLSSTHLVVLVNGELQLNPMHYILSSSTVTFDDAPGADASVEIKRHTSPTATLVDFVDGSVLRANELDTAYLHNFYLLQEATDGFNQLINEALLGLATGGGIIETETDAVIAALVNKMLETEAADDLQQRINDIDLNAEAIITLGEALQVQINTLAQGVAAVVYVQDAEPVPGVDGIPNPIADGARWYDTDDNNAAYIYLDSEWVSINDPRVGQAVSDISVLRTDVDDNAAAIVDESFARSTEDSALASKLALIGVQNGDQTAFIIDSSTVKLDSDVGDTLADRFTQLSAADDTNAASITTEETARISGDDSLSSSLTLLQAEVDGNEAAILTEQTARADGDSALSSDITSLSATVDDHTASITTHSSAIATAEGDITSLEAHYGVTLNVDGHITGFAQNNDGETGSFVIVADKFAIVDPDDSGTFYTPLQYSGGVLSLQNVEINGTLLINGSVPGIAVANGGIGSTQIGANAITTTQLNASSVTANKISAGAITAEKINVMNLAAINADLGSITAGNITLNSSGFLRGGQTDYHTGTGFFLGYSSGYKLSLGNPTSGNYMTWDGSTLTVKGNLFVGEYAVSNNVLMSADTERSNATQSYSEKKKFTSDRGGEVRLKFEVKRSGPGDDEHSYRIKRNTTVLTTVGISSTSYAAVSYDVTGLTADDTISIEIRGSSGSSGGKTSYVRNADFCADVIIPADGGTVDVD